MLDSKRREFIALVGGGGLLLAARGKRARAQQPAMPVIGFLHPASFHTYADRLRAFRQGLKEAGFVEGENAVIEYRWAENQFDRLSSLGDAPSGFCSTGPSSSTRSSKPGAGYCKLW